MEAFINELEPNQLVVVFDKGIEVDAILELVEHPAYIAHHVDDNGTYFVTFLYEDAFALQEFWKGNYSKMYPTFLPKAAKYMCAGVSGIASMSYVYAVCSRHHSRVSYLASTLGISEDMIKECDSKPESSQELLNNTTLSQWYVKYSSGYYSQSTTPSSALANELSQLITKPL
jgi:hypothetical protein